MTTPNLQVEKMETGIPGFDLIANGGLPKGRATLVLGTAGSAKTVFAAQFLAAGIQGANEGGVFITFEESVKDLRRNIASFGWNVATWEAAGKWAFVDASPTPGIDAVEAGSYDLGALLARIEYGVQKVGATRVSLDSLGAIFSRFRADAVRGALLHITSALKEMGVTAIITAERISEQGDLGRYGVEEFVADNVVVLRNVLESEKRRRTVEILKFRGAVHQKGEWPFTIIPDTGITVIPLSAIKLKQKSSNVRVSSGIEALDDMCGGGFIRDSIILVSGATGTGKTLMVTQFVAGAAEGRALLFAFEESREQLARNAGGWGIDFEAMEAEGKLRVECEYPEGAGLEDHLIRMKAIIEEFKPTRIAVDSLSALERVSTLKGFREFVIAITSFVKHQEVVGLFTSTTPTLMGDTSITEAHISTITDSIILLRYVELYGEMRRGLTVLKMRGSMHERDIREFTINAGGMQIGKPFRDVTGILTGAPAHVAEGELERMGVLFGDSMNG